ncbi:hypothetical protein [Caballeronia ptereochthonis]|uniref:Uncharacterized protein n=1 Tax=Caballeronia ptereochthonis TaxID=1777144 RepID=A0A158AU44_9BURK|nr:hypothetical protein [Caballeronia ptereochthonis]SAK61170.1 hypothetical protein AWB83_02337 [Caballeronia ptereochthonis]
MTYTAEQPFFYVMQWKNSSVPNLQFRQALSRMVGRSFLGGMDARA